MKNESLTIYRDMAPLYKQKEVHCRRKGHGRFYKRFSGFAVFEGENPVACFNDETGKMMEVVNTRGTAYACRKRLKYRRNKKRDQ